MKKLLVLGDSHSVIFGGGLVLKEKFSIFDGVDVNYLGPALAYNLIDEEGNLLKWGKIVCDILNEKKETFACVMLCFGEIDLRVHVVKQSIVQSITIYESVLRVVRRHLLFTRYLSTFVNVPIFVWGPVASANDFGQFNEMFPNVGTEVERNYATMVYNNLLKRCLSSYEQCYFFSIFKRLIDPHYRTNMTYFEDGCHLNYAGLDMAIKEFSNIVKDNFLNLPDFFDLQITREEFFVSCNIVKWCRVLENGFLNNDLLKSLDEFLCPPPESCLDFRHIVFDIGYVGYVECINVPYILNESTYAPNSLIVLVGDCIKNMNCIFLNQESLTYAESAPLVNVAVQKFVRYIKLSTNALGHFPLSSVEIMSSKIARLADL